MRFRILFSAVLFVGIASFQLKADLNYEYYEFAGEVSALPDYDALTPTATGTDPNFAIDNRNQDDQFGFRFTGYLDVTTAGEYTFYTTSDDGSALYIGNTQVVNNDGLHGPAEQSGTIDLTAGRHAIAVTFFENGGGELLEVAYEGPGIDKGPIPDDKLLSETHTAHHPTPAHGARFVEPDVILSWQAPESVADPQYDVYFSADANFPDGAVSAGQDGTVFDPGTVGELVGGTTYYWRIDVYESDAVHIGNLWMFTTGSDRGMLALYEFESDAADTSGNGLHGEFEGNASIVTDAERGQVLSLDGTGDYVEVGVTVDFLDITGNAPKSMAAWVYTRGFNDGGVFDMGAHSNGQEFSLRTLGTTNQWRIQYHGGDYDVDFNYDSLDKWVHMVLVHDGETTRMYANGELIREEARTLITQGVDTFRIGQYGDTGFDGMIDDLSIWGYALSPAEVRALMPFADLDGDRDVDSGDLDIMAEEWLTDNVVPGSLQDPNILVDFEMPNANQHWFHYDGDVDGTTTRFLLLEGGEPAVKVGDQAFGYEYEFPEETQWATIAYYLLDSNGNQTFKSLAGFDEVRLWIKYYPENTENVIWLFHIAALPPGSFNPNDAVEACTIGPFSTVVAPEQAGEWIDFPIDLYGSNVEWDQSFTGPDDVQVALGILISAYNVTEEASTGRLDFDHIRLEDHTFECEGELKSDLNGDCRIDLYDYVFIAESWLSGK